MLRHFSRLSQDDHKDTPLNEDCTLSYAECNRRYDLIVVINTSKVACWLSLSEWVQFHAKILLCFFFFLLWLSWLLSSEVCVGLFRQEARNGSHLLTSFFLRSLWTSLNVNVHANWLWRRSRIRKRQIRYKVTYIRMNHLPRFGISIEARFIHACW